MVVNLRVNHGGGDAYRGLMKSIRLTTWKNNEENIKNT